jgi:hypothetical protein
MSRVWREGLTCAVRSIMPLAGVVGLCAANQLRPSIPFFRGTHSSAIPNMLANHVAAPASTTPHHGCLSAKPVATTVAARRLVKLRELPANTLRR